MAATMPTPQSAAPKMLGWRPEKSGVPTMAALADVNTVKGLKAIDFAMLYTIETSKTVHFLLPMERNAPSTIDAMLTDTLNAAVQNVEGVLLDRLHYMETLHTINSAEKRQRVARETLDKYTTLAARAGMQEMKDRLEDLAFHQLNPDARNQILIRLNAYHVEKQNVVNLILEELQEVLLENGLQNFYMLGREKTPFSIWQKMERKGVKFEQIRDIIAFRVIVKTEAECYQAIAILHKVFNAIPGRFKDYICWARYQNYGALHTTIIGPFEKCIEVQVKTEEMNVLATEHYIKYWREKTASY